MTGNMQRDRGAAREPSHSSRRSSEHQRRHSLDFSHWHFDVDAIFNPLLPSPPWHLLPRPVSHFFGYRGDKPQKALGNLVISFWALISVFGGVLLISEVSLHIPKFRELNAPIIVGSFVCI